MMEVNGNELLNGIPLPPCGFNRLVAETTFPVFEHSTGRTDSQEFILNVRYETPPTNDIPSWMSEEYPDRCVSEYVRLFKTISAPYLIEGTPPHPSVVHSPEHGGIQPIPRLPYLGAVAAEQPCHGIGQHAFTQNDYGRFVEPHSLIGFDENKPHIFGLDPYEDQFVSDDDSDLDDDDYELLLRLTSSPGPIDDSDDGIPISYDNAVPTDWRDRLGPIAANTGCTSLLWPLTPTTKLVHDYKVKCTWESVKLDSAQFPGTPGTTRLRFQFYAALRVVSDLVIYSGPRTGKTTFTHYLQSLGVKVLDDDDVHNWKLPIIRGKASLEALRPDDAASDISWLYDARDYVILTGSTEFLHRARRPIIIAQSYEAFSIRCREKWSLLPDSSIRDLYNYIEHLITTRDFRVFRSNRYVSDMRWTIRYHLGVDATPSSIRETCERLRNVHYYNVRSTDVRRNLTAVE